LDHDGGLVDASCIALMAALQHFRRPDVLVEGEAVTVFSSSEREPIPLSILHHPLCVSFSFFDSGDITITDATLAEELCRESELVIGMNRHGEVCQVAKYGGSSVDALTLLNCTRVALEKVKTFTTLIQGRLEDDRKKRDAGGLMAELSAENERPR
jgi:exosome complex component RRP45